MRIIFKVTQDIDKYMCKRVLESKGQLFYSSFISIKKIGYISMWYSLTVNDNKIRSDLKIR